LHKRQLSGNLFISTSENKQQFNTVVSVISQQEPVLYRIQIFLLKAEKVINQFYYQSVQDIQKIEMYKQQLSELYNKQRKKIPINMNKIFTDIKTIKAAQIKQERQ
jgi:hypothetical protein